jgi:hypothetical protein
MSPLSRYVATPPDAVREASSPSEKIYSFLLKDLAEASANNFNYGQAIARPPAKWVNGKGSCWEEKSIHEATRRGSRIKDQRSKMEDRIFSAQGGPLSSVLRIRSSPGGFVGASSINSPSTGAIS